MLRGRWGLNKSTAFPAARVQRERVLEVASQRWQANQVPRGEVLDDRYHHRIDWPGCLMETNVRTPQDVFMQPQHLVVPPFHRPHVWDKEEQWAPLWHDVRRLAELRLLETAGDARHFLGAIVVQAQEPILGDPQASSIIDGQQRLTTLQLLMDQPRGRSRRSAKTHLRGSLIDSPTTRTSMFPARRTRGSSSATATRMAPRSRRSWTQRCPSTMRRSLMRRRVLSARTSTSQPSLPNGWTQGPTGPPSVPKRSQAYSPEGCSSLRSTLRSTRTRRRSSRR